MSVASPIRVVHIMGKMVGGGVESVVMNYYRHIDRSLIQFDFLVDCDSTIVPKEEIESLGGRVFFIPPYQHVFSYQRALQDLYREHGWHIVHSHQNTLSAFPLRAAKKDGIPIRIAHSHSTSNTEEFARDVFKNLLRTQANRYPNVKFACGKVAGEWLFGNGADFWIMPNAIELSRFVYSPMKRLAVRREFGIEDDAFVVLHMGRFVKQKNHSFLVSVFEKLISKKPNSVLLLAGEGSLRPKIEGQVASLGIEDHVLFLGHREDPEALLCGADCFCLPSLYEGSPVVGVEAQATGLPILFSADVSSEAMITNRAKMLPRALGPEAWAEALAEIGKMGRTEELSEFDKEALQQYDISVQSVRLLKKYLELAKVAGVGVD